MSDGLEERALERRTGEIGRGLFAALRRAGTGESVFDRWLMDRAMRDERVKVELFRFVDVLPTLRSDAAINQHLKEYLGGVRSLLPAPARLAVDWLPTSGSVGGILADVTRLSARRMARRFIAASDLPGAIETVQRMRAHHQAFTIDLLGEAVVSEAEADRYQKLYLDLVRGLAGASRSWTADPLIDADPTLPRGLPPVNVSIKLSSLYSQFDPIDPTGTGRIVAERLRPILRLARDLGVFVNVDMEQYAFKAATLHIFKQIFAEPEFRDWPHVGIAIQAYLRDSGDDLYDLRDWAEQRGTPIWIRLVKGAYWDYETVVAAQNDWPVPVWTRKSETDANSERLTTYLFDHRHLLRPAIASHNVRSIARALAVAETRGVAPLAYEFQMLYGMADPLKRALTEAGHRVRVYTPFGQLLPGMAYLVRRLLENTSNESFLKASAANRSAESTLLQNPQTVADTMTRIKPNRTTPVDRPQRENSQFRNEPLTDFTRVDERRAMRAAIDDLSKRLGRTYPLRINGRAEETGQWIESHNPADRVQVVGKVSAATPACAARAIEAARDAFAGWRDAGVATRAATLLNLAHVLRRRKFEIAAIEVMETGKPWREADADVAEAIDFCRYYASEALRLGHPQRRDVPGEQNALFYEPRGVTVVIAPWNFPLAILCGMTAAALAAGNTVVIKPAEQSPVTAAALVEAIDEVGVPPGVVNFLPGVGEVVGPTLVEHPDTAVIAFTGSRAVGMQIQRQAAVVANGQEHLKQVICELGGKNAVIVDEDADLDEAVHGVVASAFGYAGQKCSACSRVIVVGGIYDVFLSRLIEATKSLRVGAPVEPACGVGPVIDDEARERIESMIEHGRREARLVYQADVSEWVKRGSYVPPTIFADVPPAATIAQDEIFGPVLAVLRATDLAEALAIANGTKYALTGGLFSRSPETIDRVKREFRVGNLYINRKITGALVDRQPFGGFKLSGVGSKAGGPDYLKQFMVPRTITENTLRHGFAPGAEGE